MFVETVPARGYRFIAPVQVVTTSALPSAPEADRAGTDPDVAAAIATTSAKTPVIADTPVPGVAVGASNARWAWRLGVVAVLVLSSLLIWYWLGRGATTSRVTIAVLPFENLSGDTGRNYLAEGLAEELEVALDRIDPRRVSVVGRSSLSNHRSAKAFAEIGRELGADYLVDSSIRAETGRLRITVTLIRVRDQVREPRRFRSGATCWPRLGGRRRLETS